MRSFFVALILLGSALAQDPYGVKGFVVGKTTLLEFRNEFQHCADNCTPKQQKKYGSAIMAPFCSDTDSGAALSIPSSDRELHLKAGLVYCQPYFPFESFKGTKWTIADVPVTAYFDFYQGVLYRLSAAFPSAGFSLMRSAFAEKYGSPTNVGMQEYQNAYGAKSQGAVVVWDNGVSRIELTQVSSSNDISAVVFTHSQLAAAAAKAAPKHTSNDL
jgi:hypothetical protein